MSSFLQDKAAEKASAANISSLMSDYRYTSKEEDRLPLVVTMEERRAVAPMYNWGKDCASMDQGSWKGRQFFGGEIKCDVPDEKDAFHLLDWHIKVMAGLRRFTVVIAHRGSKKTQLAMHIGAEKCVGHRDTSVFYINKFKNQANRNVLFNKYVLSATMGPYLNHIKDMGPDGISFYNDSKIVFLGEYNAEALRGARSAVIVVDEVDSMDEDFFDQIVRGLTIGMEDVTVILMGTIKGRANLYKFSKHAARSTQWATFRFTPYQTEQMSEDEIEEWRETTKPEVFASEIMCDFGATQINMLPSFGEGKFVTKAFAKNFPKKYGLYVAIDPGVNHPCGIVLMAKDSFENYYVLKSFKRSDFYLPDIISLLREWYVAFDGLEAGFIDRAGNAKTQIDGESLMKKMNKLCDADEVLSGFSFVGVKPGRDMSILNMNSGFKESDRKFDRDIADLLFHPDEVKSVNEDGSVTAASVGILIDAENNGQLVEEFTTIINNKKHDDLFDAARYGIAGLEQSDSDRTVFYQKAETVSQKASHQVGWHKETEDDYEEPSRKARTKYRW